MKNIIKWNRMKKKEEYNFSIVSENSVINGDFISESNLRVDGKIKGNVVVLGRIVIGKKGFVEGDITSNELDVEGGIKGNVKVEKKIFLAPTAKIIGNIRTSKIVIEEGASFTGNCEMIDLSEDSQTEIKKEMKDLIY